MPHELAAGAVERQNALAGTAVGVPMHDVQRLHLERAVVRVHESAAVVELFDGAVHALEPVTRLLRRCVAADEDE
ncbi:hypothetical protein D3C83_56150 [compost metagenome]